MLDPNYDSNRALETLLALEQAKKTHMERNIAALEYLILAGTKNGISGALRGLPLEDLGQTLLALRKASPEPNLPHTGDPAHMVMFAKELHTLISDLGKIEASGLTAPASLEIIQKICDLSVQHIGIEGIPFILGLFMSALGEGSAAQGISSLSPSHARAVIQYILDHPEVYNHGAHKLTAVGAGNK